MTNKEKVKRLFPNACCAKDKQILKGRYIIFDDNTNPCFRDGHKSASKAWADLWKRYESLSKRDLDRIRREFHGVQI